MTEEKFDLSVFAQTYPKVVQQVERQHTSRLKEYLLKLNGAVIERVSVKTFRFKKKI